MAAFAYLLLPVTGLIATLAGRDQRARMHGLQAIFIGLGWAIAMYVAALGPAVAVQAVFGAGLLLWISFLALTLAGRDPKIPVLGRTFEALAAGGTKDAPRSTSGS